MRRGSFLRGLLAVPAALLAAKVTTVEPYRSPYEPGSLADDHWQRWPPEPTRRVGNYNKISRKIVYMTTPQGWPGDTGYRRWPL